MNHGRRTGPVCLAATVLLLGGVLSLVIWPRLPITESQGLKRANAELAVAATEIQSLQAQVHRLQRELQRTRSSSSSQEHRKGILESLASISTDKHAVNSPTHQISQATVDLHHLLGSGAYFQGISFDAYRCGWPLSKVFPSVTDAQLQAVVDNFISQLQAAMAGVLGKGHVEASTSWLEQLRQAGDSDSQAMDAVVADPRTTQWRDALSGVMARFMLHLNGTGLLRCPEAPEVMSLQAVGKNLCPTLSQEQVIQQVGYYALPFISLTNIAQDALKWGLCTKPPAMKGSFGQWLKEERMFKDEWKTFHVDNVEQDAVVFLFDVLYEHKAVFKQQYWLGSIMMQNPFDMYSITDIIYTVKPDIIIETGTANGGSALLWATMLHLNNLDHGRVFTIDIEPPTWDKDQVHWGGVPRADATQHPLWQKHVTFIQGSSTSWEVYKQVSEAARNATSVLVLLDSHHTDDHVRAEAHLWCPLVTVGSYCIIEDTKLSRFATDGPLEAARDYVREYPRDFMTDRDRELLFTHHAQGYLKRIAVEDLKPPDTSRADAW